MTEESPLSTPEPSDDGSAFLADLAVAMKETAERERERVAEDVERRREAHLATITERRESEVARMRELAEDDLRSVDVWAETERRRIQEVRERRAASVRQDLEASLAEHGSKIEREIEAVDAALEAYRNEIERFFVALEKQTDPVAIARQASRRPAFPALDQISEQAMSADDEAAASRTAPAPVASASVAPSSNGTGRHAPDEPAPVAADASPGDADEAAAAVASGDGVDGGAADADGGSSIQSAAVADDDAEPAAAGTSEATPPLVGVMDPVSSSKLAQAWAAWNSPTPESVPAATGATDDDAATIAADEAPAPAGVFNQPGELTRVAAQADADDPASPGEPSRRLAGLYQPPRVQESDDEPEPVNAGTGPQIQSMPISRPMSWLRRDRDRENNNS